MMIVESSERHIPLDLEELTDEQCADMGQAIGKTLRQFLPLSDLTFLSTRLRNVLLRNNLTTLYAIRQAPLTSWARCKGMAEVTYNELQRVTTLYGLTLLDWRALPNSGVSKKGA